MSGGKRPHGDFYPGNRNVHVKTEFATPEVAPREGCKEPVVREGCKEPAREGCTEPVAMAPPRMGTARLLSADKASADGNTLSDARREIAMLRLQKGYDEKEAKKMRRDLEEAAQELSDANEWRVELQVDNDALKDMHGELTAALLADKNDDELATVTAANGQLELDLATAEDKITKLEARFEVMQKTRLDIARDLSTASKDNKCLLDKVSAAEREAVVQKVKLDSANGQLEAVKFINTEQTRALQELAAVHQQQMNHLQWHCCEMKRQHQQSWYLYHQSIVNGSPGENIGSPQGLIEGQVCPSSERSTSLTHQITISRSIILAHPSARQISLTR